MTYGAYIFLLKFGFYDFLNKRPNLKWLKNVDFRCWSVLGSMLINFWNFWLLINPIFQIAIGNFHKVIMPFQQQKMTVIPDHFGLQLTNIIGIFESMRFYSLFPPNLESLVNHLSVVVKAIEKCQKLPNSKSWIQLQSILHRYITDWQMSRVHSVTDNLFNTHTLKCFPWNRSAFHFICHTAKEFPKGVIGNEKEDSDKKSRLWWIQVFKAVLSFVAQPGLKYRAILEEGPRVMVDRVVIIFMDMWQMLGENEMSGNKW